MSAENTENKSVSSNKWPFIIAGIVFCLFAILFMQNSGKVEFVLLFKTISANLNILVFFSFFLGLLFGLFLMLPGKYKNFKEKRALKKEIETLKKTNI